MKRRVDLLSCLRCGHQPLERQGPIARCNECGRAYPMRRPGLIDCLPAAADDERRLELLLSPRQWLRLGKEAYTRRLTPPDPDLYETMRSHAGGLLLQIGCGSGRLLDELAVHPWRLRIGVDRRLAPLLRAHRSPLSGAQCLLVRASPYRIPLRDKLIDAIVINHLFSVFKDPSAVVFEAVRLLAPAGVLVCRVERRHHEPLRRLLASAGFAYYRLGDWWVSKRLDAQSEALAERAR